MHSAKLFANLQLSNRNGMGGSAYFMHAHAINNVNFTAFSRPLWYLMKCTVNTLAVHGPMRQVPI